jgi:hypothetical protein
MYAKVCVCTPDKYSVHTLHSSLAAALGNFEYFLFTRKCMGTSLCQWPTQPRTHGFCT